MSLENIKKLRAERGFTIVELLIVIVVIGILVTIVVVAYNGVQNQARATKAKTNASSIQKRAEAYSADDSAGNGAYPASAGDWTTYSGTTPNAPGAIPTGITVQSTALSASDAVRYLPCTGGGYRITYWDYAASTPAEASGSKIIYGGGATSSSTCP